MADMLNNDEGEEYKMEKIVVLSNSGDDNLVNCLRMLFPDCIVEVHEKKPKIKKENFLPVYTEGYRIDRRVN
jgi:hypothetical protein